MKRDYEKIGREFIDISNRYDEILKESSSDPIEVNIIVDRYLEEIGLLWLKNK